MVRKGETINTLYSRVVLTSIRLRHMVIRMQVVELMVSHAPRHYLGRIMRPLPFRKSKPGMVLKEGLKTLLLRDDSRQHLLS